MASPPNSDHVPRQHRTTICLSSAEPDVVLHHDDPQFDQQLSKIYTPYESNLIEELTALKRSLRFLNGDPFWSLVAEQMAEIVGAQLSFVSKRILVDEQDTAIEMPPIGEPGACLMASALHYNDGKGTKNTMNAFKYHAYGCPCGYMRHDKVFLIPEGLDTFITNNPNELPFPGEAYLGIPLFADGKCFAHFGVMWSSDGLSQRKLSWANIELALHCLEDVILEELLKGSNFTHKGAVPEPRERQKVIPHGAVTAAQSLKPYARSLSHELRTPMQGVVGMLDVMYVTVLEACEGQTDPHLREIFENLRENIETVQDSSRRAVEAADNVVHAYDMDLHLPHTSSSVMTGVTQQQPAVQVDSDRPGILVAGSNIPIQRPNKRRRRGSNSESSSPKKFRDSTQSRAVRKASFTSDSDKSQVDLSQVPDLEIGSHHTTAGDESSPARPSELSVAPGLRHTQLRTVLQYVINEGLKVGGRPDSAVARETDSGEIIEVQTRNSAGEIATKEVEWSIARHVPTSILVDEKDLRKLISCVFLNAIKFTAEGSIKVHARMSSQSKHVAISIKDTGPGIDSTFLPNLFKPFSREDISLTRQSEGLGLGLLVAKGIARKLGGELMCVKTSTRPEDHGSEFEMRIPVAPTESTSRASSPFRSPSAARLAGHTPGPSEEIVRFTKSPTPKPVDSRTTSSTEIQTSGDAKVDATAGPGGVKTTTTSKQTKRVQLPATPDSPEPPKKKMSRPPMMPRKSSAGIQDIDRTLATKYPLSFLVAEDNFINRKLLVKMLRQFGYTDIHEAYDGAEAVRQMEKHGQKVDVILMDIWMPLMDGYEATERILKMSCDGGSKAAIKKPTVLAVTADVTDGALKRAAQAGMVGFMSKPFRILDLQRLLLEYCALPSEAEALPEQEAAISV